MMYRLGLHRSIVAAQFRCSALARICQGCRALWCHGKGLPLLQTLRARLIAMCLGILLTSLLVLSTATFFTVREDTLASVDARIGQVTQMHASEVAAWVRDKQRITSSLHIAAIQADPLPLLQAIKDAGGFDDAFLVYADNRIAFLHPVPDDFVGTQRAWYVQAMQIGGPAVTPIYADASTGELTISFVEPTGPQAQRIGAFGTDMRLASIARTVESIRPLASSFAFLVDAEGTLIAHPQADLMLKPVSSVSPALDAAQLQKLSQTRTGAEFDINGTLNLVYARQIEGTPWTLAIAIDHAEALQPVRTLLQVTAGITVLCALLREKRLEAGLQQTEVSARLKRRQPFVSDVERGVRRLDLIELQDLAAVYEVDLIELIVEVGTELVLGHQPNRPVM